jgi:DNA-directed RNA polymerase subunit RPC12/RpoP
MPNVPEKKSYDCSECGASFPTRDALRKHIYDEHLSKKS